MYTKKAKLEIFVRGYLAQDVFLLLQFFFDARAFEEWMARNQDILASKFDKKDLSPGGGSAAPSRSNGK